MAKEKEDQFANLKQNRFSEGQKSAPRSPQGKTHEKLMSLLRSDLERVCRNLHNLFKAPKPEPMVAAIPW